MCERVSQIGVDLALPLDLARPTTGHPLAHVNSFPIKFVADVVSGFLCCSSAAIASVVSGGDSAVPDVFRS